MNEYRIKVGKLVNKHSLNNNTGYTDVPLSIVEEEQLSCFLSSFFAADFIEKQKIIDLVENFKLII